MSLSPARLLIISRPFWWVNTGVPFLVGALLADSTPEISHIVGFIYFLIFYNLLMYGVNDIFDYESDIKNPRKNGSINGSVLDLALHKPLWITMAVLNIPFLIYFWVIGSLAAGLFLFFMIFMVVAYSVKGLRFKEIPILDSLTSAFHYSSPFIFGLLLHDSNTLWLPIFVAFLAWVAANHAFGAIQDIKPDRDAGISSVATKLGASRTLILSGGLYLAAGLMPFFAYGSKGLIALLATSPYLFFVVRCIADTNQEDSPKFSRYWGYFLYTNYIIGAIGSVVFIYFMYNR